MAYILILLRSAGLDHEQASTRNQGSWLLIQDESFIQQTYLKYLLYGE